MIDGAIAELARDLAPPSQILGAFLFGFLQQRESDTEAVCKIRRAVVGNLWPAGNLHLLHQPFAEYQLVGVFVCMIGPRARALARLSKYVYALATVKAANVRCSRQRWLLSDSVILSHAMPLAAGV